MAATTAPKPSITLRAAGHNRDHGKAGLSSGILLTLNDSVIRDMRKASKSTEGLQFTTGSSPKLRIGARTIDLSTSADEFQNELFASTTGLSSTDFTFTGLLTHRARFKPTNAPKPSSAPGSTDAALMALQSSLASYEQEKQAKQTNISASILPVPKNRFDAARREKQDKKSAGALHSRSQSQGASQPASPPVAALTSSSQKLGPAPTSTPAVGEDSGRLQAMRTPVVHFLAMGPATADGIAAKTHIPPAELKEVLLRVAKQVEGGKWQLTDRAFRELEVWKFRYPSHADRDAAVENAVRAYDRMRVGKEDRLWQFLLPKEERDKGVVLSKLHLGGGIGQMNRGLTPLYQPSPAHHADGASESVANTPRLGASTPKVSGSKGDVMKRLLSKDPKKARAVEDAKEKKRKDREAAASDREGGKAAKAPPAKKKANPTVKSEEFVRSSDDESDEQQVAGNEKAKLSNDSPKATAKTHPKTLNTTSSDSSDTPIKSKRDTQSVVSRTKPNGTAANATPPPVKKASRPVKAEDKSTPQKPKPTGLSAPNSQQKIQRSPQASNSRPTVPSPLGAARPRVASDLSERGTLGAQKIRQGADTPKGLGISSDGSRGRHDTLTSIESNESGKSEKQTTERISTPKQQKAVVNGTGAEMPKTAKSSAKKSDNAVKRKAEDVPQAVKVAKHRRTESEASQSQKSQPAADAAAVVATTSNTTRTPPELLLDNSPNSDAASVEDTITYTQGVNLAEKFRNVFWPTYDKEYEEQLAKEKRGEKVPREDRERLLAMHKRLEQMKREIEMASQREHSED